MLSIIWKTTTKYNVYIEAPVLSKYTCWSVADVHNIIFFTLIISLLYCLTMDWESEIKILLLFLLYHFRYIVCFSTILFILYNNDLIIKENNARRLCRWYLNLKKLNEIDKWCDEFSLIVNIITIHVYIAPDPGNPVLRRCTVLLSLTRICFHPAHIATPEGAYNACCH